MALNQDRLEKPFRKLRKALKNLPDEPSPEDVHATSSYSNIWACTDLAQLRNFTAALQSNEMKLGNG